MTFTLTNPSAKIRLLDPKTIIIDPGRMRPGDKKDTLFFSYRDGVSLFAISHPFVVDSVGTSMTMLNIDPAYCEGGVKHYVTVEGTYPGGGTATWTGTLMADQTPTSSFLDPLLGTAGTTYPISYQYISPLGCRSTIINKSVKINPLPNSSFTLDPTYNIDGGNKNLVAVTSGGNFVGPGIIGTKFYPDIAGQGTFNIVYYMTDINNCSSSTTKTTTIRKVQGTYNNPPAIVCYRDTTYTVSVSGLPSGITILDFVNSKNSVVHVPGASTATYRIPNARAGNDTLKFSYTWDGVNYTLSKPVFIDSIGKIAITGLKDNYCDYEGTSSLRVLVENSTGNGNFSFSGPAASFNNFGSVADFFPSLTPTSATPYLVSYTHVSTVNNSGCRKKIDVPVTVNKAPTVNIIKTRTTINIEEAPVLLQGVPTNGIFSGKGVYKQGSDYVFNPLVSGLGNIGIQLAYVDTKGCSTVDKDTLIVSAATGAINGINSNSQYCIDGLSDTLKYIPVNPYLTGNFIGDGISNIATEKATFNPGLAGKGDHRIAFRYSDLNGTIFEVPAILKVDEIGQILINLTPGTVYCNSDPKVPLVPTIQGGVFSGPVTDSSLDPSKQVGNTSVGYIYTNSKTGCSSAINIPVTINAVPVISFIPAEVCIEGGKDIPFTNTTTSIDPVSIWKWEFADDATSSADKAPSHHYKSGGFQQVTLTATTVNNCHSNKSITFEVGQRPSADFYWKNECLQANDSVQLVNSTISTSAIVSQSWSILGGAEFSTKQNAAYPKNSAGYLSIQYVVRTKYANCYDTVQKNIYIRPTISLATDNYFENFEAGRGGWVKELETDTTWSFGKPNRTAIITAASGNSAWFIHSSLTGQMIAHPVISPCFDFTFAKRPMISLNLFKRFIKNEDGAVLQYMIGDGTWQPLGTVSDDGIQWFNSAVIKGKPGLDQLGWTTLDTADTKWKTVYHKLDDLNGKKNVKFRISYGADSTFTSYDDGIAFDDIFIGERTRKVLIEHFTNSSPLSSTANGMVNTIAQNSKNDVINIQYHTNFPNPDPYYDDNPGDVSARILFYGLIRTPYSFVDGGNDGPDFANYYDYNQSSTSINTNDIIRRSLLSPGFDISLTTTVSGGVLTVSGKITALQNISSDNNLTLYLAVTEKKNSQHPVTGGDAIFYNVFRKFLPDAGGINLKKTWTKGETYILAEKTWVIEKIQKTSDIDVISYIQDNVKRDVYQAASKTEANIIVGIENLYGGKGTDFALYPNPAVNKLTISFEEPLTANADIKIYDIQGMVIRTFKAGSGSSEFTIDNIGLKGGMYMVRVTVGGKNLGFKKLIVSGD